MNFHLADDVVLPCVRSGLYIVRDGDTPLIVAVAAPAEHHGSHPVLKAEVMVVNPEAARIFLADLRATMLRLNVYRGHVVSLSPGSLGMGPQTLVAFHSLPHIAREDVVLPEELLARRTADVSLR